jgi:hypothetical protein
VLSIGRCLKMTRKRAEYKFNTLAKSIGSLKYAAPNKKLYVALKPFSDFVPEDQNNWF